MITKYSIIKKVFKILFKKNFNYHNDKHRELIILVVSLLENMGFYICDYVFLESSELHRLYCEEANLGDDKYKIAFNKEEEELLKKIQLFLDQRPLSYTTYQWLNAIWSLYELRGIELPLASDEGILRNYRNRFTDLKEKDDYNKALEIVEEIVELSKKNQVYNYIKYIDKLDGLEKQISECINNASKFDEEFINYSIVKELDQIRKKLQDFKRKQINIKNSTLK